MAEAQEWGLNNERLGYFTVVPFPLRTVTARAGGIPGDLGKAFSGTPKLGPVFPICHLSDARKLGTTALFSGNNITELLLLRRKIHQGENSLLIMV